MAGGGFSFLDPEGTLTGAGMETTPMTPATPPLLTRPLGRLLLVQALFGICFSLLLVLPKILTERFAADARDVGLIMGAFGAANVLCAPWLGRVVTRLGYTRALRVSCLLMGAATFGFVGLSSAGLSAAVLRGVQGAAWGMAFTAASALAAAFAPPARLAQAIALVGSASLLMNAVGPPVAELLLASAGPWAVYLVATFAALLAFLAARRLRDPVVTSDGAQPSARTALPWAPLIAFMISGLAVGAVFAFHQPLALERGVARVSDFFIATTAAALFVRLCGAQILTRFALGDAARVSLFLYGAVTAAMAAVAPGRLAWLGLAFGAAHGVFYPSTLALAVRRATPAERGGVVSAMNAAFNLGLMGVFGLGYLARGAGYPLVFILVGAATALTAVGVRGLKR
jgi:MFS family permease